ncbi:MAG: hypothetical protein HZA14_05745 [Nitrospirae bacterium]|nr:hypothetical protein [Nitrospirota bacterium]
MLKKPLRYFFTKWEVRSEKWEVKKLKISKPLLLTFSFLLLTSSFFTGCAAKTAPPPQYMEQELSLEDVIKEAGDDIEVLKAIAEIRIEKNNEPQDFINASILVKKPDWVHMRIYKLGMLVRDFVVKDGALHVLAGPSDMKMKGVADEFFNSIFWWENLDGASMNGEEEYIIKTVDREIHLDRATLLPVRQEITAFNKGIHIRYDEPRDNEGFWYQSSLEIYMDDLKFTVKLEKLIKNPVLTEYDFRTPY